LIDVARQLRVVREVKAMAPSGMVFVGSAYSYLQEFLPFVAQSAVAEGWTDLVGIGRMALSYPRCIADAVEGRTSESKLICRTLSDCTTAPRKGLPSGCYPLDPYYAAKPEAALLKKLKRAGQ
jgi:2,4-dienoyl-CoA reductase-like NADH-dependent reductase (Old Yellow Enzyme family)